MQNIKKLIFHKNTILTTEAPRLFFLFSLLLILSCEDFVQVELPNSQINGETVFENIDTATAAVTNIYAELRDDSLLKGTNSGITNTLGHFTDELDLYSASQQSIDNFYRNIILSSENVVLSYWNTSYSSIYAANSVIEGIENSNSIQQADKNQLMGEALFLRAFIHFYLLNLFGEIPYIESTDYQKNSNSLKISVTEVYEKIVYDLLQAKDLLSDTYLSEERTRPNKGAVSALLARVYLYNQNWIAAEQESTEVIANTGQYAWETDLNKVFLKESTSTIWQFKGDLVGSNNTSEANLYVFTEGPPPLTALSNTLIDSFELGDNRFANWVNSATNSDMTSVWYYVYKYKEPFGTEPAKEYSILFRLAEQYLIRAEARAHLNDITGSQSDLNIIRTRANLTSTAATTTDDLLDAILQERQVELFIEYGHRFFDLKRMDKLDERLGVSKPNWQTINRLLPIPETELLVNENLLPQNDGY